ncbi:MAG: EamA family transporter RarD [Endozoicomonadaceae bacterium]|nr:EamA family transporter RarD [Endozoicomonadaceae bacterium]
MISDSQQKLRQGALLAIAAYTMWGIAPIYFKLLSGIPAIEILSHRVIWSFFLLAILLHCNRRWKIVQRIITSRINMLYLFCSTSLIGLNWLIYIWAINSGHVLEASLGYYINPLINVILGMVFLGENLRKLQWIAVMLTICGVLVQLIAFGSVPVVAIALASSFAFYGLLRKKVNLNPQVGLFVETLLMLPVAAIYLFWVADTPTVNFFNNPITLNLLLVSAGLVTTLPLLCFATAATRLKLSTLGFFQYIGPSLMFLLAVLMYGEPFTLDKVITFAFIWTALIIFSFDGINYNKHLHKPV